MTTTPFCSTSARRPPQASTASSLARGGCSPALTRAVTASTHARSGIASWGIWSLRRCGGCLIAMPAGGSGAKRSSNSMLRRGRRWSRPTTSFGRGRRRRRFRLAQGRGQWAPVAMVQTARTVAVNQRTQSGCSSNLLACVPSVRESVSTCIAYLWVVLPTQAGSRGRAVAGCLGTNHKALVIRSKPKASASLALSGAPWHTTKHDKQYALGGEMVILKIMRRT
mmetsp:Transcript_7774/g.17389  ORF Transcript_7774/g.17389 Transcript_7774/m.17389 type:complete len:224 (-) Transcript_7774:29-700(-)